MYPHGVIGSGGDAAKHSLIDKRSRDYAVSLQTICYKLESAILSIAIEIFTALLPSGLFGSLRKGPSYSESGVRRKFSSNHTQQFHGSYEACISIFIHGSFRLFLTRKMVVQGRK